MKISLADQIGHLDEVIADIERQDWRASSLTYLMQRRVASLRATREALVWLINHRDVAEAAARNETERRLG